MQQGVTGCGPVWGRLSQRRKAAASLQCCSCANGEARAKDGQPHRLTSPRVCSGNLRTTLTVTATPQSPPAATGPRRTTSPRSFCRRCVRDALADEFGACDSGASGLGSSGTVARGRRPIPASSWLAAVVAHQSQSDLALLRSGDQIKRVPIALRTSMPCRTRCCERR